MEGSSTSTFMLPPMISPLGRRALLGLRPSRAQRPRGDIIGGSMKVEVDDPSMGTFKSHKILSHYRPDSYLDPHYRPQMHGDTKI